MRGGGSRTTNEFQDNTVDLCTSCYQMLFIQPTEHGNIAEHGSKYSAGCVLTYQIFTISCEFY
jgi:hypothetical protein